MTADRVSLDHVSLPTYLQIDAAPNGSGFRVTIRVVQLQLVVEAIEQDVGDAIHAAADLCAERLREQGYPVTAADVLGSLEKIDGAESSPAQLS
ncbi:MAG TPA: hypothetical protein VE987_20335 [Polyangiaceae bacterium]|nr:hypothetical protein [Polyangiaceae bacterium]